MNTKRNSRCLLLALGILLGLAACEQEPAPQEIIKPTIMEAASPTVTEEPAPTAVPEPTATPTPSPTFTPTPSPTPVWTGTEGEVTFSEKDHFFAEPLSLILAISEEKEGYITYTMDNTEPLADGIRYEAPLLLEGTENATPEVYTIRAKAWYADGSSSDTYVHTYFVGVNANSRYTTMILSIHGDAAELTEGPDGILYGENYRERGSESERKVYIEAISSDGEDLFSQYAGVRVYGGGSREFAVKSLKFYARKEYQQGKGTFETTVFGSTTLDGTKPIEKYDKLILRAGGDDFQHGFIRDELAQRLAGKAGFAAYEAVVPAVAYLNGEYYGLFWLHESYCDKYFQYRNGKSKGEYIVLEGSEKNKSIKDDEAEAEAAKEYNRLYKKYSKADLTDDTVYAEVNAWIDVENYLDYMAFNMYISNYDWPQGNYRCFRYYPAEGEKYGTGEKDGRWRFLMHDADIAFATYYKAEKGAERNDLAQVTNPNHKRYSALLTGLLKREDCRTYFVNKLYEYRDGALSYESVCETLDAMCGERDAELPYYFEYLDELKETKTDVYANSNLTKQHVERIKEFAKYREEKITEFIEEYLQKY